MFRVGFSTNADQAWMKHQQRLQQRQAGFIESDWRTDEISVCHFFVFNCGCTASHNRANKTKASSRMIRMVARLSRRSLFCNCFSSSIRIWIIMT